MTDNPDVEAARVEVTEDGPYKVCGVAMVDDEGIAFDAPDPRTPPRDSNRDRMTRSFPGRSFPRGQRRTESSSSPANMHVAIGVLEPTPVSPPERTA